MAKRKARVILTYESETPEAVVFSATRVGYIKSDVGYIRFVESPPKKARKKK